MVKKNRNKQILSIGLGAIIVFGIFMIALEFSSEDKITGASIFDRLFRGRRNVVKERSVLREEERTRGLSVAGDIPVREMVESEIKAFEMERYLSSQDCRCEGSGVICFVTAQV